MSAEHDKPTDSEDTVEVVGGSTVQRPRRASRKLRVPGDAPGPKPEEETGEAAQDEPASNGAAAAAKSASSDRPAAEEPTPRPVSVPPAAHISDPPTIVEMPTAPDDAAAAKPAGPAPTNGKVSSLPPPKDSLPPTPSAEYVAVAPPPDLGSVVRQVRRKIRSVGTGSKPPPSLPPPERESAPVMARTNIEVSIPMPVSTDVTPVDDEFNVPPVDVTSAEAHQALRPALTPSIPSLSDFESIDAVEQVEPPDEPTEEITVPTEIQEIPTRKSIPDAKRPPVPPPAAAKPPPVSGAAARPAGESSTPATGQTPSMQVPAPKKRRRPWWEDLFNDDYFRTMPKFSPDQITSEGDFIEASLGVEKGAVVLDVACGDGRQSIELAVRGYEVIALDLSLPMLSRASDEAQERGAKLNFLHSDMREMEFNEMFDAAYCMSTSFGYFDDEKNADVVKRLHKALKVGGTLLLDVVNRDYAMREQPSMCWYEGDGCVCMEETSFNFITSRLNVKRNLILDDGKRKEIEFSIRLYSLHELGQLLHTSGFRIVEISGNPRTPGAFFGADSRQMIILAQKQKRDGPSTGMFGASSTGAFPSASMSGAFPAQPTAPFPAPPPPPPPTPSASPPGSSGAPPPPPPSDNTPKS